MRKNILIGVAVFVLLTVCGVFFWAQAILACDSVRTLAAAQMSKAIGHPEAIGSISATIFPRVAISLGEVTVGEPARVRIDTLHVGTAVSVLLSRRIEHAGLRLAGARIELPLPPLGTQFETATPASATEPSAPPATIVSIDDIVLSDVEIVSGGRTLRGDIEAAMEGQGLALRNITLEAEGTTISTTGRITDLNAPAEELGIKARQLNVE